MSAFTQFVSNAFLAARGSDRHALARTMAGIRLGERLLLVGDDGRLFAALAGSVGLTGRACAVAASPAQAARLGGAAAEQGVLLEVHEASLPSLPFARAEFDVAVIDVGPTLLSIRPATELARAVALALRPTGRAVVVERRPTGLGRLFGGRPDGLADFRAAGGAVGLLRAAGFDPVRVLACREGQCFTEGLNR